MRVLVLNSTQSRQPRCEEAWVRATLAAVDHWAGAGHCLVVSWGTVAWELALWRAASLGARLEVICPLPAGQSEDARKAVLARDFGLDPQRARWVFVQSRRRVHRLKDVWEERDEIAWSRAETVVPVAIRPRGRLDNRVRAGRMDNVVADSGSCGPGLVDESFRVPWRPGAPYSGWERGRACRWPDGFDGARGAIVHFTRACSGPWPGELASEFYRALACGTAGDPRDARATVERMLGEGTLRGSETRIRGGYRAVCFTAAPLAEAIGMLRWRTRYARASFEPYAVAIGMDAAVRLGARPVEYDAGAQRGAAGDCHAIWRQGTGGKADWVHEREWRIAGDVDLNALEEHEAAVLVACDDDVRRMRNRSRFPVDSLGLSREEACSRQRRQAVEEHVC